jgi:hypothetical protein
MPSVLMNKAEVYASRIMLQLAPVSASALRRCSSLLTMRLAAQYQPSECFLGEINFFNLVLVLLKVLKEVLQYSSFITTSG